MGILQALWNILLIGITIVLIIEKKFLELGLLIGTLVMIVTIKECYLQIKNRLERHTENFFEENKERIIKDVLDANQDNEDLQEIFRIFRNNEKRNRNQ